ncbi:MerR family transcriptional regulator [Paenibacillus sp. GP183]|uniref:MerR family transcriptional regulator n=1 Tax=Paenibacillus sp. GP183 TaxID=1882751 RepID=UPI00089CA741|nr:MerR family transcriptional regulator [Paenibacillus sp. GP183]SED17953.1 DNA-binding transcriptional regulator, MerR family [Paenibacillus sp. GP183]
MESIQENSKNTPKLLTQKQVSDITGLSDDLIRLYEKNFNIQVSRTNGGHRRYSKENVELLNAIKKKIQEQNWSYDQVSGWLNGEVVPFEEQKIHSNLEKKVDDMQEMMQQHTQMMQFFLLSSGRFDPSKPLEENIQHLIALQSATQEVPQAADPVQQKTDRMEAMFAERRVLRRLENEALKLWQQKPEQERVKRVGLFRKEEDHAKRQDFVKQYVDEHYEEQLRSEFGFE